MDMDLALNIFATLFVTIDPLGMMPIFIALTQGMSAAQRRTVAFRSAIIAFGLLTLFAIAGTFILNALGITLPAFRIAGGFLLFYISFEMIFEKREERKSASAEEFSKEQVSNIAAFPLAIPLIAGPGSISAVILLSSGSDTGISTYVSLIAMIIAVLIVMVLVFMASTPIDKFLGSTGRMIMSRLMGVLLAALSVQFVIDGVTAVWQG